MSRRYLGGRYCGSFEVLGIHQRVIDQAKSNKMALFFSTIMLPKISIKKILDVGFKPVKTSLEPSIQPEVGKC